jgi:hypothetical protein
MSASHGSLRVYRVTGDGIRPVSERAVDLERTSDREHYNTLLQPAGTLPVEYCKLLEYRRNAQTCWRPGLGLR